MKLQWLPVPSSKGGWNYKEFVGFDRFGIEKAMVLHHEGYNSSYWHLSDYLDQREFEELKDAQLAAEAEIEDEKECPN